MLLWFDPRKQEQLIAGHVFIQAGGVINRNDCKIKEKKLNKTFDEYDDVIPFIVLPVPDLVFWFLVIFSLMVWKSCCKNKLVTIINH